MSLESGKKCGFIASLINVVMPVVSVVLVLFLYMYLLTNLASTRTGPSLLITNLATITNISFVVVILVGFILFLLGMYRLSKHYSEPGIFKNVLYAFALNITVGILIWVTLSIFISSVIGQLPSGGYSETVASTTPSSFVNWILAILAAVFIAFILIVISAVLYWRAFNKLAEKSGVESFKTAGLLYLIGTVLYIIGVGVILVWIAWIYAAIGYHQLKPQPVIAPTYPTTSTPILSGKIYCPHCGTENDSNAIYCKQCGKPLSTNQVSV